MEPTPAKKPRKANFSASETLTVIEEFQSRKDVLQSKLRSFHSNRDKQNAWQQITDAVNAVSTVKRTVAEVKEKWSKLSTEAKTQLRARRNPPTGSGKSEEMPNLDIMADIFEGSTLIEGIKEGSFDSGEGEIKGCPISLPTNPETTQEEMPILIVSDDTGHIIWNTVALPVPVTSLPSATVTSLPSITVTSSDSLAQPPTNVPPPSALASASSRAGSLARHRARVPPAQSDKEQLYMKYLTVSTDLKENIKTQLQSGTSTENELKELQKEKLKAEIEHAAEIHKLQKEKLLLMKQQLGQE